MEGKNREVLMIINRGCEVLLGPDEMEGDFSRGKLRKEVSFFYLINPIKINIISLSLSF